jgi:hypothetical protein
MRNELRIASGNSWSWLLPKLINFRFGQPSRSSLTLASVSSSKREASALLLTSNLLSLSHLSIHGDKCASPLSVQVNSSSEGISIPSEGNYIL